MSHPPPELSLKKKKEKRERKPRFRFFYGKVQTRENTHTSLL